MPKVHDEENRDADVRGQEVGGRPVLREEHGEAVDEAEDGEGDQGYPGTVGLDKVAPRGADVVVGAGRAEAEEDDHAADPGHHAPCL